MSSWTDFDLAEPAGGLGTNGASVLQAVQDNQHAIWNMLMMGSAKGMLYSVSGGTAAEPANIIFSNGTNRLKAAITWGVAAGALGNWSSIDWSVSQDNGASYAAVCTQGFTYDGSGNLTATTGAGGMLAFVAYLLGRFKALATSVSTITGALGTMANQAASSVAITGGVISAEYRGRVVDLGSGTPANTFTIDWQAGEVFLCSVGANFTFAETNAPPNGFEREITLSVTGALGFTATLPAGYGWGAAGAPTWTAGPDLIKVFRTGHASSPVKRFITFSRA